MKSEAIKIEIEALKEQLEPLQVLLSKLERDYRDTRSREFIAAHGITKDQVEASSGEGKPWFGHLKEFVNWLGKHPGKPWAEWNGTIYLVSDLKEGDWGGTPALFDHLS